MNEDQVLMVSMKKKLETASKSHISAQNYSHES